mmetsp:Transcript_64652/g.192633  ORF Transcript_64652/g.192633 Transcript_64652/m.192633 type:complete len:220 (+) Transcript_64652:1083-1742(+)
MPVSAAPPRRRAGPRGRLDRGLWTQDVRADRGRLPLGARGAPATDAALEGGRGDDQGGDPGGFHLCGRACPLRGGHAPDSAGSGSRCRVRVPASRRHGQDRGLRAPALGAPLGSRGVGGRAPPVRTSSPPGREACGVGGLQRHAGGCVPRRHRPPPGCRRVRCPGWPPLRSAPAQDPRRTLRFRAGLALVLQHARGRGQVCARVAREPRDAPLGGGVRV